eukprot:COSAG06_NODE_4809_length_3939_cov_7.292448_3_plen_133_part_00
MSAQSSTGEVEHECSTRHVFWDENEHSTHCIHHRPLHICQIKPGDIPPSKQRFVHPLDRCLRIPPEGTHTVISPETASKHTMLRDRMDYVDSLITQHQMLLLALSHHPQLLVTQSQECRISELLCLSTHPLL